MGAAEMFRAPEDLMQPNFEGFFAFHRDDTFPRFEERFEGRGMNRISQTMELRVAGYEFWVHPAAFVCHPAERFSYDVGSWDEQQRNIEIYQTEWLPAVKRRHSDQEVIRLRHRHQALVRQACPAT